MREPMKVMTMLDVDAVDLEELALEDNSAESSWWIDPETGALEFCSSDDVGDNVDRRGLIRVEPVASHEAYVDMARFVELVRSRRPRELLERAIQGRGAFRRFKDTLLEFPDLREEWFSFHDRLLRRRGIEWLAGMGLVDPVAADAAQKELEGNDAETCRGGGHCVPGGCGPAGAVWDTACPGRALRVVRPWGCRRGVRH